MERNSYMICMYILYILAPTEVNPSPSLPKKKKKFRYAAKGDTNWGT